MPPDLSRWTWRDRAQDPRFAALLGLAAASALLAGLIVGEDTAWHLVIGVLLVVAVVGAIGLLVFRRGATRATAQGPARSFWALVPLSWPESLSSSDSRACPAPGCNRPVDDRLRDGCRPGLVRRLGAPEVGWLGSRLRNVGPL